MSAYQNIYFLMLKVMGNKKNYTFTLKNIAYLNLCLYRCTDDNS